MLGEQVKEDTNSQYTSQAIAERIPASVIAANILSKIKKEGTKVQQNEHIEKSMKHAAGIWKKQLSSEKWQEITLDQHLEMARNSPMDYDKVWANREHIEDMKNVMTLMSRLIPPTRYPRLRHPSNPNHQSFSR